MTENGLSESFKFHSPISRSDSIQKQRLADILLFLPWDDVKQKGILTGKIFEYIGAGRPILSISSHIDDASEIVLSNSFGAHAKSKESVEEILLVDGHLRFDTRNQKNYERADQVQLLIKILRNVCKGNIV